jgi:hypothetical protein
MKKQASVYFTYKCVGINPFENYEDYYNADLDTYEKQFTVTRIAPTKKKIIPEATVEIKYLGKGSKEIKGVESKVYKEASRYLKHTERNELNKQWKAANKNKNDTAYILNDLFLTKNLNVKDLVTDRGISTLYKILKGDLELTKKKAIEYAEKLNIDPASLMFDTPQMTCWSNVNLKNGKVFVPDFFETHEAPRELYSEDLKAIKVVGPETSPFNNWIAYYDHKNKIDTDAHNKFCYVRERILGGQHKNDYLIDEYRYYLGIYQIYGTKKRIINIDPTAEIKIIKDDVRPEAVSIIKAFKPENITAEVIPMIKEKKLA